MSYYHEGRLIDPPHTIRRKIRAARARWAARKSADTLRNGGPECAPAILGAGALMPLRCPSFGAAAAVCVAFRGDCESNPARGGSTPFHSPASVPVRHARTIVGNGVRGG